VKSTSKFIKAFCILFVVGLVIALVVPFATRSSRADQQLFALAAGDQLTVTCPTKLKGMRHGQNVMLICEAAEGHEQPAPTVEPPAPVDTQPTPDGTQPTPEPPAPVDTQPTPDANQPTPDDTQPTPDGSQPTPDANQPTPDGSQPAPDDSQAEPAEPDVDPDSPNAVVGPEAESQALAAVQEAASVTATTTNPFGCAAGEIATDAQAWWMPMGSQKGNNFGHLHTTVCFPHMKTLSGKVNFRIRSVLHNNPGQFRRLMVQIFGPNHADPGCNDDYAIICKEIKPTRTLANCTSTGGTLTDNGMTCTWWDTLTVDTNLFDYDGIQEFRFRGFVREPDGNDMRTSTGLHAYVKNGHTLHNYTTRNFMEARGWYASVNYTNARLHNPPTGPVSGVWKPSVELKPGSGGAAVTSWYASIDGDFHKGNPGTPICPSGVKGDPMAPICGTGSYIGTVSIDTTKLTNGWHRLFLKADAASSSLGSTNSGVLAILFEVKN
jgi:outer membrane biosynthesis protein TonB